MKKYLSIATLLIVVSILIQEFLFDCWCDILRPSFFVALLYNAIPALLIAPLCTLPKQRHNRIIVTAIGLAIIDIWLIANYMYFQVNGLFITWQVAQLAHNLHGFESSLLFCWSWKLVLFPFISLLTIVLEFIISSPSTRWTSYTCFGLGILLYLIATGVRFKHKRCASDFNTEWFSIVTVPSTEKDLCSAEFSECLFVRMHSIMTYLGKFCYDMVMPKYVELTEAEQVELTQLLHQSDTPARPINGHLVFVLVESMEGWLLEAQDATGQWVCPHIRQWMETRPTLSSSCVHAQKKYGESGDGQLICMTGLLPIDDGVACNLYGENSYPNFAHFYASGAVINPCTYMWNQDVVTFSYGFKTILEPQKEHPWWNDSIVIDKTISFLSQATEPSCVLAITLDSHMPFECASVDLPFADSILDYERRYLNCFHHVDMELGRLLSWADTASCMHDATIVITGDHYASHDGFGNHPKYVCPLVISSPNISESIEVKEMYQMDIYPTILDLLGQTDYIWQGFGLSALKTDIRKNLDEQSRPYTPSEAFALSDKLIRSNFFAKHLPQQ